MKEQLDYIMVTPAYPPSIGGVERHVFETHFALRRMGLRGRVVVLQDPPSGGNGCDDGVTWMGWRRLWGRVPKTGRFGMMWRLGRFLRDAEASVIHFHDSTIYPVAPALKVLGLMPRTYMTFHGWEGVYPPRRRVIRKRRRIAAKVCGNIAIGDFIGKWYGTASDFVSYGGVDAKKYGTVARIDYDPDSLRIAYFGRLEPDTGVLDVAGAVRMYGAVSNQKVRLDLYGRGSLEERLAAPAGERSASVNVLAPVKEIAGVLERYGIIVASGYLSILEALCAERIVFAYYHNPLREDYLRMHPVASSMFICGCPDDVVRGLSLCRSDPERVAAGCRAGWEWAKKQSWNAVARMYAELWNLKVP